jgi:hypothetical protein
MRRCWKLKEEALDRTLWRTRPGKSCGLVRQTITSWCTRINGNSVCVCWSLILKAFYQLQIYFKADVFLFMPKLKDNASYSDWILTNRFHDTGLYCCNFAVLRWFIVLWINSELCEGERYCERDVVTEVIPQ